MQHIIFHPPPSLQYLIYLSITAKPVPWKMQSLYLMNTVSICILIHALGHPSKIHCNSNKSLSEGGLYYLILIHPLPCLSNQIAYVIISIFFRSTSIIQVTLNCFHGYWGECCDIVCILWILVDIDFSQFVGYCKQSQKNQRPFWKFSLSIWW